MDQKLVSSPDFIIRPPETAEEVEAYFHLNAQAFRPDEDPAVVASRRRRLVMNDPDFHLIHLRSAFYGKTYVGSCRIQERVLYMGPARLLTGCIGGVVTHPDYRRQGIATALMKDALTYARDRQYALLLLHGIPNFYYQLGFSNVLDDTPVHTIERDLIPDQHSACTTRLATDQDAPVLLALYQQHYGTSIGSFAPARTVERQRHYLENWFQENIPVLALNGEGQPEGYLLLSRRRNRLYAYEVAANTWPATQALLQYHSHLLEEEADSPAELSWPLPLTDATYYFLADHFPLRSEIWSQPDSGWMARPASLAMLVESLLPLWQERWQRQHLEWRGMIALKIGTSTCFVELQPQSIHLLATPSMPVQHVTLSEQVFTQLAFGFRPIAWAAMQPEQDIPRELITPLNVLFPLNQAWIAGSDYF